MSLLLKIRDFLSDPRLRDVDYDSDDLLKVHREILLEKRMMKDVFAEFYSECVRLDKKYFKGTGRRIEIGAGVSFFKALYPDIISTDIKKADNIDMVADALNMPFEDDTVRGIYGLNCFHHFPDPEKFFRELKRVLHSGGGCILIEPYYGPVAGRFFKRVFATETFDPSQKEWRDKKRNVMSGANQALSYIVFVRDAEKLSALHPEFEVVHHKPLNNYLRYLLSGGLNFRPLLPSFASPLIRLLEILLTPLNRIFALHHIIVIRKKV